MSGAQLLKMLNFLLCNRLPFKDHHQPLCSCLRWDTTETTLSSSLYHLHPVGLLREWWGSAVHGGPHIWTPQPQMLSFNHSTGAHSCMTWAMHHFKAQMYYILIVWSSPNFSMWFSGCAESFYASLWTRSLNQQCWTLVTIALGDYFAEDPVWVSEPQRLPTTSQSPAVWKGPMPWQEQVPPCEL